MQRIYGTSFFSQKDLDQYLNQLEEAKKLDHRKLGRELELFSMQEEAGAGLIFWMSSHFISSTCLTSASCSPAKKA